MVKRYRVYYKIDIKTCLNMNIYKGNYPEKEEEEEQAWYDQGLFGNLLDGLASEQPGYPPVV